jgi:transcriptional regulator with XRE-family HTH domain
MGGQYDEHGPQGPDLPDTGEVFEGEVVLPEKIRRRRGHQHGRIMDEDLIRDVIQARRVKKWSLKKVAEVYGVSHETVAVWAGERDKKAPDAPDVLKIRREIADSLEVITQEAWRIHDENPHAPKVQLEALGRLESVDRARSILHGVNAPVRHDVTLVAVTEAERELQEMINEAKAKEAVREAAVIEAANNDPDL